MHIDTMFEGSRSPFSLLVYESCSNMHERLIQWIVIVSEVLLPLTGDVLSLIKLTMLTIYGTKVHERVLAISLEKTCHCLVPNVDFTAFRPRHRFENTYSLVTFEKPFLLLLFFFFPSYFSSSSFNASSQQPDASTMTSLTRPMVGHWNDLQQHLHALGYLESLNFQRSSFNDIPFCPFYELIWALFNSLLYLLSFLSFFFLFVILFFKSCVLKE